MLIAIIAMGLCIIVLSTVPLYAIWIYFEEKKQRIKTEQEYCFHCRKYKDVQHS